MRFGNHIGISAEPLESRIVFSADLAFSPLDDFGDAAHVSPTALLSPAALSQSSRATPWHSVANGDFDNDGKLDEIGLRSGSLWIRLDVLSANAAPTAAIAEPRELGQAPAANLEIIGSGDFDNDGWLDLLSADSATGEYVLHQNNGAGFDSIPWGTGRPSPHDVEYLIADVDEDGFLDLLSIEKQGQGHWTAHNTGRQFVMRGEIADSNTEVQNSVTSREVTRPLSFDAPQGETTLIVGAEPEANNASLPFSTSDTIALNTPFAPENTLQQAGIGLLAAGEGSEPSLGSPVFGPLLPASTQIIVQGSLQPQQSVTSQTPDSEIPITPQGAAQATVDLDGDDSSGATGNGFINTFTEEDGYVRILDTDFVVNDQGEDDITEIVIQPTAGVPDGSAETIIFRRTGGVSSVRLDGSETTVFSNSATDGFDFDYQFDPTLNAVVFRPSSAATIPIATVNLLMDGFRYYNTDDDPDAGNRTFDIFLNDNSSVTSTVGRATIQVNPVNDAPVIDLDGDNSANAPAIVLGRDSVDLDFVSSTNVTGALFNGDTISVTATAIFSSGYTATDPAFVASYFERTEGMRLNDNTSASITFSGGAAPTGTLLVFHDVDQNESVTLQSSSGTPLFVEQAETISGETTTMPTWNPATGELTGDAQNGVGGATIFDISGLSDLTLNVGSPGTISFGFVTPGLHPINFATSFTEGDNPTDVVDSDVDVNDVDNTTVESATVTLTNGQIGDQLVVDTSAISALGLTVSGPANSPLASAGQLAITLTGPVTHANLESALTRIEYENTSGSPDTTDRIITLSVDDSQAQSLTAQSVVQVSAVATDLALTKTDGGTNTEVGDVTTYTLTVGNLSTLDATGVVLTETLPTDTVFNAAASTSGWVDAGGGSFTFQVGTVAAGASTSVDFAVELQSTSQTELTNTASVVEDGAAGPESDTSNNAATDTTTINPSTGQVAGVVFTDSNNDGVFDSGEAPIDGVTVALTGTTSLGNSVSRTTVTDTAGEYSFDDLPAGTYTVTETQPSSFTDGQDATTSSNSTVVGSDAIQIVLSGTESQTVTFGEIAIANQDLSLRDLLSSDRALNILMGTLVE